MSCIGRTVEDVKKLVHHAKLVEDELHPITQVLEFTPDFGCDGKEIVLLELDAKVLETLKEDSAVLRGDPEAGAVLCTKSRTYEVREAETSNSLVLIPHLSLATGEGSKERTLQNRQVCGIHHTYLEIRPCKPRTQKLRELLEECPYSGSQGENQDGEKTRYTWSDLLDLVQCSEEELDKALQELEAYHLYGFWQMLEFDYHFKVVSHILNMIETKSWPLDGVPRCEAIKGLSELEPRNIMTQCFDYYLKPSDKDTEDGDTLYTLRDDKVCRLCAEVLLRSADKYNLHEFLSIWQQSVPEGLTTNLSQLEGLALVDRSSSSDAISYFPVTSLPQDIQDRFNTLFATRDKWTFEEIRPYIEDLAGDKTPVNALLTKYARASTLNGIKYYSGKHAR
ncbi:sister chromatid cohesion protein DCC1 isoform X1 [Panulirus ornatus]|uniref:sister chromatid cohesion protein DCC1 isoform X1 n=1 Tax=Panulirus ornatus TaxID=150431 RepID=UPI003A865FF1